MTPWRSRISLGDLIAAAKRLEADAETTRSIAELLGIVARRATGPARRRARRGEVPVPADNRPVMTPVEAATAEEAATVYPDCDLSRGPRNLTPVRSPAFPASRRCRWPVRALGRRCVRPTDRSCRKATREQC